MNNLRGVFYLVAALGWLLDAYGFMIIIRTLLSWLGPIPNHPIVFYLKRLTDPFLRLIHRHLPFAIVSGIDVSPMIALLLIYATKRVLIYALTQTITSG